MPQWRYRMIANDDATAFQQLMNEGGEKGWELVNAQVVPVGSKFKLVGFFRHAGTPEQADVPEARESLTDLFPETRAAARKKRK
jgi:hypothetical protein